MELTLRQKEAVTKRLAQSYRHARKPEQGTILDGLIPLTGYHRSSADARSGNGSLSALN